MQQRWCALATAQRARLELRRGPLGRELAVHAKRAAARRERCFQRRHAEKRQSSSPVELVSLPAARAFRRAAFLSLLPGAPAASFVGSAALLAHRIRLLAAAQRPKLFRLHDHESRLVQPRGAALPGAAASPRSTKYRDHSTASAAANRE
ncbi:hypothetical protein M885DRAFT_547360 [Pelagophyceae sp. CCMP2097]|nr:hypothetical protein M885DRAFT_547360 [Pelagophyceae sp. CCMP2097]